MNEEDHLSFFLEWYDPQADLTKPYILHFYGDETLELIERKTRRPFLKRIRIPTVSLKDLYIGASINIYSRQLTILEAANEYTRNQVQQQATKATFLITPQAYASMGRVLSAIEQSGPDLQIVDVVMVQLDANNVSAVNRHFSPMCSTSQLTKDVSVAVEAKLSSPNALEDARVRIESLKLHDAVLVGECGLERVASLSALPTTAVLDNCTLCLLKPCMLKERRVGQLLDAILGAGYEVSALKLVHLTMADADEFFRVYKGIFRQYHEVLKYMTSAPCIAIEVRGEDVVRRFREFCGPHDVHIARTLRPQSLRARFGKSNLHNAVHCTDCPEDGELETQFLFTTVS